MSQATAYLDTTFGSADMQKLRRRAIVSCAVGNFVELFDFVIYGLFATQIGANFFPSDDPLASLLQQLRDLSASASSCARSAPSSSARSAICKGRKIALVLTVGLMATATAVTGLIPPYASIGIWAPILLVALPPGARLLDRRRMGRGGGLPRRICAARQARPHRLDAAVQRRARPHHGHLVGLSPQRAPRQGGDDRLGLARALHPRLHARADRLLSALAGRRDRPPSIASVAQQKIASSPVRDSLTLYSRPVAGGLRPRRSSARSATISSTSSCRASPRASSALPASTAYLSTTLAAVVLTVLTPVMGALSDKLGRKPILLASALAYAVLSYPLFLLLTGMRNGARPHAHAIASRPCCLPCMPGRSARC